jgi:tetratricopeptide (TPR) repeat protein
MLQRGLGLIVLALLLPASLLAIDIDGEVRIGLRRGLAKPATVQLLRERQVVYEQYTDLNGRFEFRSVEPTRYVVRAIYDSLPEVEVVLDMLGNNSRYRVPITLKPAKEPAVGKTQVVSLDQLLIPNQARKEYEAGLKNRKAGDCSKAVQHLQKAVALAPGYGEAFNELGICRKNLGDTAGAEKAFLRAVELRATIYPSMNLADLYAVQKRFDDAGRVLEQAIAENPSEGDLLFALARIQFDRGDLNKAEELALHAHDRIHRTADVHLLLAKIYLATNKGPSLVAQLEAYLIENPAGAVADQVRRNLKALRP